MTVDESQGGVTLDITISREVEVPFVCEIATEPISAEGTVIMHVRLWCFIHYCMRFGITQ